MEKPLDKKIGEIFLVLIFIGIVILIIFQLKNKGYNLWISILTSIIVTAILFLLSYKGASYLGKERSNEDKLKIRFALKMIVFGTLIIYLGIIDSFSRYDKILIIVGILSLIRGIVILILIGKGKHFY